MPSFESHLKFFLEALISIVSLKNHILSDHSIQIPLFLKYLLLNGCMWEIQ